MGLTVRADAAPTKHQKKLYRHESGFLGASYSKLHPDPGNGDWLGYFNGRGVLRGAGTLFGGPGEGDLVGGAGAGKGAGRIVQNSSKIIKEGKKGRLGGGTPGRGGPPGAGRDGVAVRD